MAKSNQSWIRQPSWWVVLIAGALFVTFAVAIVRELINSHQVRQQVKRLETQVASEQGRQQQLQDLIDYLGSPTFREQEARLKLGLKKEGESVIVVPTTNAPTSGTNQPTTSPSTATAEQSLSRPQRWWQYFFGPKHISSSPNA